MSASPSYIATTTALRFTVRVSRAYFECKHCGKLLDEHAGLKCLLEHTTYESRCHGEMLA
jgi:hypothetical protein